LGKKPIRGGFYEDKTRAGMQKQSCGNKLKTGNLQTEMGEKTMEIEGGGGFR